MDLSVNLDTKIGKIGFQISSNKTKKAYEEENEQMEKALLIAVTGAAETIGEKAQERLSKENNIDIGDAQILSTVVYQFLRTAIKDVIEKGKACEDGDEYELTLMDIVKIRCEKVDGELKLSVLPTITTKQKIKDDTAADASI